MRTTAIIISLLALFSGCCQAKPKPNPRRFHFVSLDPARTYNITMRLVPNYDTIPAQKDTITKVIVLVEKIDTMPVTILYKAGRHQVRFEDGYYLRRGLAYPDGRWANRPLEAILDQRRRPFLKKLIDIKPR